MLILLPPSEGKSVPRRGKPLDLGGLGFPELADARAELLAALVELCRGDREVAAKALGLGPSQRDLVDLNTRLTTAPTARADAIYTGVLYDALDLAGASAVARRRAATRVAVTSALFGLVRVTDRIPPYRLSGDASLPGIGPVAGRWRQSLGAALESRLSGDLLVDLRSSTYAAFWRPPAGDPSRVATVRVLHEVAGKRQVVSHFNKATKGRLARALLEDGGRPRTASRLAELLGDLGWQVEAEPAGRAATRLDVVVSDL